MEKRNPPNLKLTLYADLISQPARAVVGFCKANGINFELKELGIMKGAYKTEAYKKISPMQLIPALVEVDERTGEVFNLAESATILRYLATTRDVADHWYPSDARQRAVVDMYLDQHHSYLRVGITQTVLTLTMPRITKQPYDKERFERSYGVLVKSLVDLENRLSSNAFICGPEKTIADLTAACELDQGQFFGLSLGKYPKVQDWLKRMINDDPINDELAQKLRRSSARMMTWMRKQEGYPKL